jgi:trehalose 6-phosphate synthase
MAARRRLIVVSNRGPATFSRDASGMRTARRGGGGLVTALRSLVSHHDVTWIASAISDEDRRVAAESHAPIVETAADGATYLLRLIAHDPAAYDRYYNVVANPTLWFAQHYLWGLSTTPDVDHALHAAWSDGYLAVNAGFARAVTEELERGPDAAVFFHDYHLYVAPRLVRPSAPEAALSHFVHIPWPQPDYWRVLPVAIRSAVHDGLLANDVVSFHTDRWRLNFLRGCEDILGADVDFSDGRVTHAGRSTYARVAPISVDPAEFAALADDPCVLEKEAALVEDRPERLVLRVDRTDPSKNVVRGFRAFERYLEQHPEVHGRVVMLALLDPSRQDIPEYSEYLGAIQRAAEAVNDRFHREGWTPIDLRIEDDFLASVAAYKQYDALLVNAIFDGMNLVAKEAPLLNRRDGVLILSENAGAHEELGPYALTINPFDIEGQAEAIHLALTMPEEERVSRLEGARAQVRTHDIGRWIDTLLRDLDEARAASGSTMPA